MPLQSSWLTSGTVAPAGPDRQAPEGWSSPPLTCSGCASSSPAARAISARRSCACCAPTGSTSSASTCCRRRTPTSSARSPTARSCARCVEGVDAVLHAATLHKPHVGSHGRQEFVDTNVTGTLNLLEEAVAAGVGRFVFTSTTSAFGARADAAAGRARRVDHRGRRAGAAQHLRRHQGRGRGPLRARAPRPRPAVPDPAHVALLPGGRRPRRRARRLRRRQRQGQRAALPPGRHRGRRRARTGSRSSARRRSASGATSSAPPRRSSARTSPSCATDAPAVVRRHCPETTRRSTRRAAGGCSTASSASTSTSARGATSAGRRAGTSAARSTASRPARSRAATSRAAIGAKGYHAESTGPYTVR